MMKMKNFVQSVVILIAVLHSTTGAEKEEVVYAQEGATLTLQAPRVDDLKTYYLHWYFGSKDFVLAWCNSFDGTHLTGDKKWKDKLSLSGNSLVIKDIQQDNFGTFFSEVKYTERSFTYQVVKLNVNVSPASPLLPGETLSLTCTVETPLGHSKPEIHWLNPQGEKLENNQGSLTVRPTGRRNGLWTCVVRNDRKEAKVQTSVTVLDLSPAPFSPQYTSVSSPLTVPCSIPTQISWEQMKAKGILEVHWHFFPKSGSSLISRDPQKLFSLSLNHSLAWKHVQDRGLRPVADLKGGNLSLTKDRAREDDRGDYVCTLNLRNGVIMSRTIHVNVLQITSTAGTALISGQKLDLICSLGRPLPSGLSLKWLPPDQSSLPSLGSGHHPSQLTITAGTGDGGKWRCELWQNDMRVTSAVITLKIEPKLSVWMRVIICSVSVIVVLLLIFFVFILFRCRQRRMRHPRHRLCRCKNPKPKGFYTT